jgi:hypothetical protein
MRRNVNLDIFTDELHNSLGVAAVCLAELPEGTGHDYFAKEDLVVRTAAGGLGVLLAEGVHYALSEENAIFSTLATNAAGVAKTIYKKIQITDPVYQACDLYFSGKYFTDYADPEDLKNHHRDGSFLRRRLPRQSSNSRHDRGRDICGYGLRPSDKSRCRAHNL